VEKCRQKGKKAYRKKATMAVGKPAFQNVCV